MASIDGMRVPAPADDTHRSVTRFAAVAVKAPQFAYTRFPHQPLTSIQRFHEWIHTTRRMSKQPLLGITSQIAFVIVFVLAVQPLLAA
jgi:hypothetical protein